MRRFEGRSVLVIGASSGIGLATARRFAAEGAAVICTARNEERLNQTISELPGAGHRTMAFDAANEGEVDAAAAQLKSANVQLHAAAMCAGYHALRPLQILKAVQIDDMLSANLRSALLCTKLAVKNAAPEGASIVWLSSAAATIGNAGEAAYAASKGALISACRALAAELATRRIRINAVAPGVVETPMAEGWLGKLSPEQRESIRARHLLGFGKPDDVAGPILFLASDEARWITGACLAIDGGLTCH